MPGELLIKGGYVVTMDPDLGDLPAGDVLMANGLITAVGKDLRSATAEAEVIDAAGRLIIPGLVDTHRHVWQGAIGGYTPQITGAGYGPAVLTGIAVKHAPDDVYAGALWGALQALDAGITTIADWAHNDQSPAHADADLRGLRDSGIRGYFLYGGPGPATDDPNPPHPADARRVRDEYFASGSYGRLRMGMALRGPAFTSPERNAADFAFARDLGLPVSIHAGMAGTGDPVTVLERYGLLGSDVNYVHGNFLTDREWHLLADSGGTVTITPSTDMLMQFGTFPATGAALSRGIISGFGIDTICSAGTDLFSEMRLALAAERSRANATAISADKMAQTVDLHQRDMLRLATIGGARVWHLDDEIGTLTPGKQADIAVIDMRSPHLDGFGDPVAVMVLGAGPADVGRRRWNGAQAYSDSKLFDVVLAFAVARHWPAVLSNALEPGWVPTKMGGPGAPDDLSLAPVTQAWLAVSDDPAATVTAAYFYHQRPRQAHPAARDTAFQDQLLDYCASLTGTALPEHVTPGTPSVGGEQA